MDKNIFLISYLGGMHGEFLAKLISQDQNYYFIESNNLTNNKYQYLDPLHLNNIFIKLSLNRFNYPDRISRNYKLITDNQRKFVDINYNKKNLCVLTHIWNDNIDIFNLPRLKPIRLYCNDDYLFFAFCMAVIKAWTLPFEINDRDLEFFISNVDTRTRSHIEKILERKFYYWIERLAISKKQFDLDNLISFYFLTVYNRSNEDAKGKKYKTWQYLNIGNLMTSPESSIEIFRDCLQLHSNLSLENISEYHQRNCKLIHDKFNLTYENLSRSLDRFSMIKDYIINYTDRDFWLE